jgi:hypothetical protein
MRQYISNIIGALRKDLEKENITIDKKPYKVIPLPAE